MGLLDLPDPPACDCNKCKQLCSRPGWPTPEEVEAMMADGLSGKLMCDYWEQDNTHFDHRIEIICPANPGYEGWEAAEGLEAVFALRSGCAFQDSDTGHCQVHGSGYKPIECRLQRCKSQKKTDEEKQIHKHLEIARLWDTDRGRAVVRKWKLETGCPI